MNTEPEPSYPLEIANLSGAVEIKNLHAPRLPNFEGKTIGELSNRLWEATRIFPFLRDLLLDKFPGLKVIPYTEFPRVYEFEPAMLAKMLKERGCDAVIVGNAA